MSALEQSIANVAEHIASAHASLPVFFEDENATLATLRESLGSPTKRHGALWVCLLLPEQFRRSLLSKLVDLCAVGHSDIWLARLVLLSIDREWLAANVGPLISAQLERPDADEEEYRRFAELLVQIDSNLLAEHVSRALAHASPDVREVGEDYS